MAATVLVKPNTYAIGPSLYDFSWDKFEQREREREARDAAFEEHLKLWCQKHQDGKGEIGEIMNEALNDLYNNREDSKTFDHALFVWFCSSDHHEANDTLLALLEKHIRNAVRKEWERKQEAV